MAKTTGQKLKLLTLYQILHEQTDEAHPMTIRQMIAGLAARGIAAERKSISEDLKALADFGVDILEREGPRGYYYLASRTFDMTELQLLADAVASSQFITEKKSQQLIGKLMTLTSRPAAGQLERQIYQLNGRKQENERIFYNVDAISRAIGETREISFRYFEYTADKTRQYRHDGARYVVIPYALCWDNENYYMIADYPRYGRISNFRVDRMEDIQPGEVHPPNEQRQQFRVETYTQGRFSMFGGEKVLAALEFRDTLAGAVMDRFGRSAAMESADQPGWFRLWTDIVVSPPFWGWLFQFGDAARVASPPELVTAAGEEARRLAAMYAETINPTGNKEKEA